MVRGFPAALALAAATLPACTSILGLDAKPLASADASSDGGLPCTADGVGDHDPANAACWAVYSLPPTIDPLPEYAGASFDGHYVYFLDSQTGSVVRHDVSAAFDAPSSWTVYDTTSLQGQDGPYTYAGIVFDGRYMYFVPSTPALASNAVPAIRYDTTGSFTSSASWASYSPDPSSPVGFAGGTFDGRYVYLAPNIDADLNGSGVVTRYDSTASFESAASWTTFDVTTAGGPDAPNAGSFYGAVFDGRYAYFIPGQGSLGVVARYDSTADFGDPTAWAFLATSRVSTLTAGSFYGGAFDGRSLYLAPSSVGDPVLELNVEGSFTSLSSWSVHIPDSAAGGNQNGLAPAIAGAAYDGRLLYFVPAPPEAATTANGLLSFYDDVGGGFTDAGAWSTFDTTTLDNASPEAGVLDVGDFGAAVFDGRYLYLAPGIGGAFARFDARAVASQPALPHYFGSFF